MIRTWRITQNKTREVSFGDRSSLDIISRQLPGGYYSTFRTYDSCTRAIGFSAHLRRLPNIDESSLRRQLVRLLEPYRSTEARVRMTKTIEGQVYVSIEPLKLPPARVYEKGIRVETVSIYRNDPRTKSTAFIGQSDEERKHIAREGIFEALLVKNGRILEGLTSNFFYVYRPDLNRMQAKGELMLCTAQRDILLGVTRRIIIRVARRMGTEVRYRPLKLSNLSAVREAFITSSSRGVIPVIQIDDVPVGQGKIGKITRQLSRAYNDYVITKAEKI